MKISFLLSSVVTLITYLSFSQFFIKLTAYLHPIAVVVLLLCLFILVFFVSLLFQKKKIKVSTKLLHYFLILYSLALLVLLFFRPSDQTYHSINVKPFSTIFYYLSGEVDFIIAFYNVAANIGLFVPFGLYMVVLTENKKHLSYYQFSIPIINISTIEILQYFTHRGSLDVDDLILNLSGVYLGFLLSPFLKRTIQIIK